YVEYICITPQQEWIREWAKKGFKHFILIENEEIRMDDVLNIILDRPTLKIQASMNNPTLQRRRSLDTKYLGFWSIKPGMGVSTFLCNAGVKLAKQNKKVLLLEWDSMFPSIGYRLGLFDGKHNLDEYAIHDHMGKKDEVTSFVLNKKKWLELYAKDGSKKEFVDPVQALPESLDLLVPNTESNPWEPLFLDLEQCKRILDQVDGYYDYVLIDIPSELIHSATGISMKKADQVFVFLDGNSSHLSLTSKVMNMLRKEFGEKYSLLFNQIAGDNLSELIQDVLETAPLLELPYDQTLHLNSFDMLPKGNSEYEEKVHLFTKYLAGEDITEKPKGFFSRLVRRK
ncbi:MinD/ParA family ATP-binding protein, partial [Caldalkalibacillus mannanilyticus]|uniref:MinD/ParA family ATP-binding protein n=1 Tax=Caldalkalibacillus mannanilyticus TaxID=1418 RepID=UPI0005566F0C